MAQRRKPQHHCPKASGANIDGSKLDLLCAAALWIYLRGCKASSCGMAVSFISRVWMTPEFPDDWPSPSEGIIADCQIAGLPANHVQQSLTART